MTTKTRCPHCGRLFKCVEAHQIAKPCRARGTQSSDVYDDDESFADRTVQAQIDRACGIPNDDDWLLS